MAIKRIGILGAGPAGIAAAWRLRVENKADVVVLERQPDVGGNAGSFEVADIPVDYGSHRLHPACDPVILRDLRALLGDDLLDRPRHGRIRLRGRWIHFPLKPLDLVRRLPPSFSLGVARDAMAKLVRRQRSTADSYQSILERGLGRTICTDFYFPYARKIWGLDPSQLSPIQARRRVSAGSLAKIFRKVLMSVPGLRPPGAGRFFYPRNGFGEISRRVAAEARRHGADIRLGTTVTKVSLGNPHRIEVESDGRVDCIEADHVWTTLPITVFARLVDPPAPEPILHAAKQIRFRAMILIYVSLPVGRFSPFDAHYFPETAIPLSRLSEPKNYGDRREPADRTVLCGELPCTVGDDYWRADDESLGQLLIESLSSCGLPVTSRIIGATTRRLPFAYPIYTRDYEEHFGTLDEWIGPLDRVLTFGRQGLFAHDNTHHAMAMSYAAASCLGADGAFDRQRWERCRVEFESHVVED